MGVGSPASSLACRIRISSSVGSSGSGRTTFVFSALHVASACALLAIATRGFDGLEGSERRGRVRLWRICKSCVFTSWTGPYSAGPNGVGAELCTRRARWRRKQKIETTSARTIIGAVTPAAIATTLVLFFGSVSVELSSIEVFVLEAVIVALRKDYHSACLKLGFRDVIDDTDLELWGKSSPTAAATLSKFNEESRLSVVKSFCVGLECQSNP